MENSQEKEIIGIYRCVVSGETFEKKFSERDDVPPDAVSCQVHAKQDHFAELVNIKTKDKSDVFIERGA